MKSSAVRVLSCSGFCGSGRFTAALSIRQRQVDVLGSSAAAQVFAKYGSYFHPQAYPEGCPQHPSYAQGHGSVAGACATILKAAFAGSVAFESLVNGAIQVASEDGLSLLSDAAKEWSTLTAECGPV